MFQNDNSCSSTAPPLVDKFIPTKNLGRALPSVISISLIVVGLLLLTAMSIYAQVPEPNGTIHKGNPDCKYKKGDPNGCIDKFEVRHASNGQRTWDRLA